MWVVKLALDTTKAGLALLLQLSFCHSLLCFLGKTCDRMLLISETIKTINLWTALSSKYESVFCDNEDTDLNRIKNSRSFAVMN